MPSLAPPGPAELLANAIDGNGTGEGLGSGGGLAAGGIDSSAAPSTATSTSGLSTPDSSMDDRSPPTATTTITTTHDESQEVTSITHVGASAVASHLNKDGSFSIRPIAAKRGRKVRTTRTHTFTARSSQFDRDNQTYQVNASGFFTLFWILVFVGLVRTGAQHYSESGVVWGNTFATLISRDAQVLALSDGIMVLSTFLCVPFVKLMNAGWLRYNWAGLAIQHTLQTVFLFSVIRWTFYREWPWVQSGFMTLHCLTLVMKVHSYLALNGDLSAKKLLLSRAEPRLHALIAAAGGPRRVEEEARIAWAVEEHRAASGDAGGEDGSVKRKDFEADAASGLRRRRKESIPALVEGEGDKPTDIAVLTWHPDAKISELATEVATLREALTSTGVNKVVFPANVSYFNFIDYLLVPTLVYELEYPRTDKIRPLYILEKSAATFGTFSILVLIVEHYILPVSPGAHSHSFLVTVLDLAVPFMVNYLLIFYIIFECICNGFAEITRFSDREFYSDWWNSVSFDEFSRRWNVPVHAFLLRHVYTTTITTYHFSKFQAAFTTFLLSAAVHELVMAVVTKKLRLYLFILQMAQLPLIVIGRLPILRKHPALGNLFFWFGLLSGFPLLAIAYIRY